MEGGREEWLDGWGWMDVRTDGWMDGAAVVAAFVPQQHQLFFRG